MLSKAKKKQRNFETGEFLKENINIKYSVKVLKFHGNVWVTALPRFPCFRNLSDNDFKWESAIKTAI